MLKKLGENHKCVLPMFHINKQEHTQNSAILTEGHCVL